jgi:hypothetical protein
MKLDMNEVYHQYIMKVVIFAIFTFKRQLRQPNVYKQSVITFVNKRLPWKINLYIDTGEKLSKQDERDLILDELLNGIQTEYLKSVSVIFTTPLKKDCVIEIDLTDEKKYENFLYS